LRREADRHRIVRERQHKTAVNHLVRVQPFAVNRDHFGRGGDDGLELVRQRAALAGVWLFQFVENDNLRLQLVTPLAAERVVVEHAPVA
jgi:hypothetical protein